MQFLKALLGFIVVGLLLYVLFFAGIAILAIGLVVGFLAYAIAYWKVKINGDSVSPGSAAEDGIIEVEYFEVNKTDKNTEKQ